MKAVIFRDEDYGGYKEAAGDAQRFIEQWGFRPPCSALMFQRDHVREAYVVYAVSPRGERALAETPKLFEGWYTVDDVPDVAIPYL